eukprot:349850-Chlamydomonas_euryale.AAC.10
MWHRELGGGERPPPPASADPLPRARLPSYLTVGRVSVGIVIRSKSRKGGCGHSGARASAATASWPSARPQPLPPHTCPHRHAAGMQVARRAAWPLSPSRQAVRHRGGQAGTPADKNARAPNSHTPRMKQSAATIMVYWDRHRVPEEGRRAARQQLPSRRVNGGASKPQRPLRHAPSCEGGGACPACAAWMWQQPPQAGTHDRLRAPRQGVRQIQREHRRRASTEADDAPETPQMYLNGVFGRRQASIIALSGDWEAERRRPHAPSPRPTPTWASGLEPQCRLALHDHRLHCVANEWIRNCTGWYRGWAVCATAVAPAHLGRSEPIRTSFWDVPVPEIPSEEVAPGLRSLSLRVGRIVGSRRAHCVGSKQRCDGRGELAWR